MIVKILKIAGIIILSFLLIASLFATIAARTASVSINSATIKPVFQEIASSVLIQEIAKKNLNPEQAYDQILIKCGYTSGISIPLEAFYLKGNATIGCDELKKAGSLNESIKLLTGKVYDQVYNNKYSCSGLDCLTEKMPLVWLNKDSEKFFIKLFYLALLISILILAAEFFLFDKKKSFFITNGMLLIVISLLIIIASELIINNFIPAWAPAELIKTIVSVIKLNYIGLAVFGAIFICTGVILAYRNSKQP